MDFIAHWSERTEIRALQLVSDHKYLRICDLCQELGIIAARCIIAVERERQAKTDACLVPLCPLASMVPVFWR
jgi:hypothetical protein